MPHKDPDQRRAYMKAWRETNGAEANRRYEEKHKAARREAAARWRALNPERLAAIRARYVRPEYVKARHRAYTRRQMVECRLKILTAYGGRCVCCGETELVFLTIDHAAGGGSQERRRGITAPVLYPRIIKEGFPPTYRLLCWNCNAAVAFRGQCPHPDGVKRETIYEREQARLL